MTREEHISLLVTQAQDDFGAANALAASGYFAHALFWSHLVMEKLCKALWMKKRNSINYPYIHNLIKLLDGASANLSEEQMIYYADMNQFQVMGRYTDTLQAIEKTVTKEICDLYFSKTKTEMTWLINQLQ